MHDQTRDGHGYERDQRADDREHEATVRGTDRHHDERDFQAFEEHPFERERERVRVEVPAVTRPRGTARLLDLPRVDTVLVVEREVPRGAQQCLPQLRGSRKIDVSGNVENGGLVQMARGNLQVELSSGAFLRRLHMQNFHQPELIPAVAVAEFYRIHALSYKVQAQAARPYIFERAPAHLFRIHRCTTIFQHDLKGIVASAIPGHMDPAEGGLDGLLWVP